MHSSPRALAFGLLLLRCAFLAALTLVSSAPRAQGNQVSFDRDVQPILADRCFTCHGPDSGSRKAGLRLDLGEHAYAPLRKGKGKAIVPGNQKESVLLQRIDSTDPDFLMPPPQSKLVLSAAERATLRTWVEQGARYEVHWAFRQLPLVVPVPSVQDTRWARDDLDRFVLARLEAEGLHPAGETDKATWLRRASYDLIGLPPAPEELAAFLADDRPDAYSHVVQRLLASPHYGERMAVPWLDAVRYADSYGYQSDQLSPTWPFRDWVVRAFNSNLAWDRFLQLQLAGDLVQDADRDSMLATAMNRLHRQTNEGGSIEEEFRVEYAADRVNTLGNATMGLTLECARCHDHKFDPITQRDYYSLFAFFDNIDEWGTYNDGAHVPTPSLLLPTPDQEKAMRETDRVRAALSTRSGELPATRLAAFREWLREVDSRVVMPGLVGHFAFEDLDQKTRATPNASDPRAPGTVGSANQLVEGHAGRAVRFSGDDPVSMPSLLGALPPWQPFTVAFWIRIPDELQNAILFHRTSGTDTGFHGTELVLEDRRLRLSIQRFWPGNAIAIRSRASLPSRRFVHVAVGHDGSARAAGLVIYVDGVRLDSETLRDELTKSPGNGGSGIDFGERFRSFGAKGADLDEVRVYDRALAPIEVRHLQDGHALADALAARDSNALFEYWLLAHDPESAAVRKELASAVRAFYAARDPVVETMVMKELAASRPTFLLARGRYDAEKSEERRVARDTPAALPAFPADAPRNRLGLARWLGDPSHPLTARAAVNRFWQLCFGRGIVEPVNNFGRQGARPTHPELLDWLAREFVSSGQDVKALLARIVLSATYRQSSIVGKELRERDPDNTLLARGPSHRLSAEMVRDTALLASGLMNAELGGPPVSPYQPGDLWREANSMSPAYKQSVGAALHKRSLYTVWKRTAPMPNMVAFDAPSREVCTLQRASTTTPQQALVLLNDPQFVEAARALAERTVKEGHADTKSRIHAMFTRLAGRAPDAFESKVLCELESKQRSRFLSDPESAAHFLAVGDKKPDPTLDPIDVATLAAVAQAILNLDAVVWKR